MKKTSVLWVSLAIVSAALIGWLIGSYSEVTEVQESSPPSRDPMPATFQQIGMLTPSNGGENKILPLFARRLHRDRWQYYAISNQHNDIKLPVKVGKKSALDQAGVQEQYTGDKVYVEGYNELFDVRLYDYS